MILSTVSVAKMVREIEEKTNENVGAWLYEAGLTIAAHKTKDILISGQTIVKMMKVTVVGTRIELKRAIKYMVVIIDDRLNFKEHVKYIDEKTFVTQRALAKIKPNIGGPGPFNS